MSSFNGNEITGEIEARDTRVQNFIKITRFYHCVFSIFAGIK